MTRRTPAQYDWATCSFDERILPASPRRATKPRTGKIEFIGIHHMTIVGDGTGKAVQGCINTWKTREASAHYGVEDTLVAQFVWDRDSAWALADNSGNQRSINIEHANSKLAPSWTISAATLATSARLVANLHKQYKLGRPVAHKTIRWHQEFYATACPGPYFTSAKVWNAYVANCQKIYDEITSAKPAPVPPVAVPPKSPKSKDASWSDPSSFKIGATGPDVLRLGQRLVVWAKALGLPAPYKVGPGSPMSATDVAAVKAFQLAQGWTGVDADGYPGPTTLKILASDPPAKPAPVEPAPVESAFTVVTWNLKSPTLSGSWPVWSKRRGGQVDLIKSVAPDVLLAQEVGSPTNELWYTIALAAIGLTNMNTHDSKGTGKWRAIWASNRFTRVTSGLYTIGPKLNGDAKQMAECIVQDTAGRQWYFGSFHLENNDGKDKKTGRDADDLRVDQIEDCFKRMAEAAKAHSIPPERCIIGGDTNSQSMVAVWVKKNTDYRDSADQAKTVLDKLIGSITNWLKPKAGARQDYIFVHKNANVDSFDQRDGHAVSDHNPQIITIN